MTFIQIMECKTDRVAEFSRLMDTWVQQTEGKRTATHGLTGVDRADSRHIVEIIEFPSYGQAMLNSELPETDAIYRQMVAICDAPPTFTDVEVFREDQL